MKQRSLWELCQLSDPALDWQTGTPTYSHLISGRQKENILCRKETSKKKSWIAFYLITKCTVVDEYKQYAIETKPSTEAESYVSRVCVALHSVNLKTLHNRERKFYSEIIIFQIAAQHIWTSQSVSIRTSANNSIQSWQLAVQSNKGGWKGVKLKAFSSIWELENLICMTRTSSVHISPGSR